MQLIKPLTIGKKTITEINFRDYTIADDYLSFDNRGGVAQRIALIASLTGTDEVLIKQLHGVDYVRAERIASKMLDDDASAATEADAEKKLPVSSSLSD